MNSNFESFLNNSGINKVEQASETQNEFCCDICRSPFVINPLRSRKKDKYKKSKWSRKMIDSITNKVLSLCNACGLRLSRAGSLKIKKTSNIITDEERQRYTIDTNLYRAQIAELTKDPAQDRLVCPNIKKKLCRCLEKYVTADVDDVVARVKQLLKYHHEAERLRQIKPENQLRRSVDYQNFILKTREILRNNGLCEFACQRILIYSNNFLHKKLKTSPEKGPRLVKKTSKESLHSIPELSKLKCCRQRCTKLAITYPNLIASWRRNAALNRISARKTLAEMLIPSGAGQPNCVNFLQLVTGCSTELICKVSKQLVETGGDKEPPEHGLKLAWQQKKIMQNQKHKVGES